MSLSTNLKPEFMKIPSDIQLDVDYFRKVGKRKQAIKGKIELGTGAVKELGGRSLASSAGG
jgi:hypothetical protein